MVISNTLLIKHLPNELNDFEKESFLKYFGAKEIKCISSKHNKYNIAFAKFENENEAQNVLHRLHQINILDSCLSVEYTKKTKFNSVCTEQKLDLISLREEIENDKCYKQFIEKLASWHAGVDFRQPVPSHLKYQYPPPNIQTLVNIIKVLATIPKFYTQVLHLMNKMNLPCPFGKDVLPEMELEILANNKKEKNVQTLEETEKGEVSMETSESEISSDEESKKQKETIPELNKIKKKTKIKVPKFFKPATVPAPEKKSRKTTFEEVFEKVVDEKEPKKIKLNHIIPHNELLPKVIEELTESSGPDPSTSGFGYIHPLKKVIEKEPVKEIRNEREEERLEKEEIVCISKAELAQNRISEKDRSVLPVFKNYAEGAPTCRLYIKNLAKTVTNLDLRHIYSRYLAKNLEDQPNMFDIRLMQEGRMKGQAFVTLQSVELAQKALKETNGYILKDKPLVVQFARSAVK